MLVDVLFGPICAFESDEMLKQQYNDLLYAGFLPLYITTKGELYNNFKSTMPPERQQALKGFMISFGYSKIILA